MAMTGTIIALGFSLVKTKVFKQEQSLRTTSLNNIQGHLTCSDCTSLARTAVDKGILQEVNL
jgi:hypothetical protein